MSAVPAGGRLGPPMALPNEPDLRSQRLGSALRGLAAELVDERREVARLRQQVAELQARLESLTQTQQVPRSGAR